jgi:hypothetical protein
MTKGRTDMSNLRLLTAATVLLTLAGTAYGLTDEEKCIAGRIKAKGTYVACVSKVFAKLPSATYISGDSREKITKCVVKYAAVWDKLSALEESTTCGGLGRFVDNGATVTDRLTLLTWEKKSGTSDFNPNPADLHDPDNNDNISLNTDEDGGVFSVFLAGLNAYPGLDNARSWRIPTLVELLTVVDLPDLGGAIIGPIATTTLAQNDTGSVWTVNTGQNAIEVRPKWGTIYRRAVRGGL